MRFNSIGYALSALALGVTALDCSSDQLSSYRLKDSLTSISSHSIISDTPPSKTNTTWYLNLCNQNTEQFQEDCPKNSQICGITTVLLPGESPIKTQVVSIPNNLNSKILSSNDSDILINLDDSNWGSNTIKTELNFHCAEQEDIKIQWDLEKLIIDYISPSSCLKDNKSIPEPPKDGKDKDGDKEKKKDDSWGWFTWLFIILVIGFGGYIIFGAWVAASKSPADFQDAMHDFLEALKSLPGFIKEIFAKVFGNENRGGYSAV
ncbi:Autophagy-related protein [Wickerhamomyces ciferrii]|uniref:Autophagy-related protein 27 n=1 Tax=Wickerhamomyces ciferrii (strain ATCC 14091 / BCRC 22168 / CBS 111 / JCM 3599 / NBRC 0793 / NRRL Y-1031 F-60-10) TaxID=1206466 RepID=K0KCY8_WICCF|nr:Autophagy-related protein [Wickerhamomyces ciferrii]CCH42970.1 Autophagy-related protein [Wickerhamomyces ciferrii]